MCEINPAIRIIENRGRQEGIEQGIEQGMEKGRLEMIVSMANVGVDKELIAKGAKCSVHEIEKMLIAA